LWKRSQMPLVCGLLVLNAGVIDILDREIELVFVPLWIAAIFAAAVGQHPQQPDLVVVEERKHPIIEQIRRCDRGLAIIELGATRFAVGIDTATPRTCSMSAI
jgi:hypothetical protein